MITEFDLGQDGVRFVLSKLAKGDVLAQNLLELQISDGRVTVYLPSVINIHEVDLEDGGLGRFSFTDDYYRPVYDFILAVLAESPTNVLIVENGCLRTGFDHGLIPRQGFGGFTYYPSRHRIWTDFSGEGDAAMAMYTLLRGVSCSADQVRLALQGARQYPLVAALTSLTEQGTVFRGQQVEDAVLQDLAKHAEHILIGAYDEEAIVIWHRGKGTASAKTP
jgi:hypothetical protein